MKRFARVAANLSGINETGANCPCVKHFFRCLETSGAYWNDSKGGVTWPFPAVAFDSTLQTVEPIMANSALPVALSSGAWEQVDTTKSFVMVLSGQVNIRDATATRCSLGDLNNLLGNSATAYGIGMSNGPFHADMGTVSAGVTGIKCEASGSVVSAVATGTLGPYAAVPTITFSQNATGANNATGHVILDGGTTGNITSIVIDSGGSGYDEGSFPAQISGGVGTGSVVTTSVPSVNSTYQGRDVTIYIKYQPGVAFYMGCRDSTTGALIMETSLIQPYLTPFLTVPTFTPSAFFRAANIKFYGMAIIQFAAALPANIDTKCWWMGTMWKNGKRVIHPELIGVA